MELAGLGGAASLSFGCTNCGSCSVKFETSSQRENGDAAVSKILQVATICSGASYAIHKRMFHHILGMHTVSDSVFFGTLKEMYDHVKDILDGICLEARKEMQDMDQEKLGSWQRAVTCGDAVWLTRGSFSRNCTYTVRNYLTGALLYYCHICQKGSDNLCQDDIYEGTSKAAEGFGANEVFKLMVKDQMNVECHIQDGDSTSENVVLKHFPLCRVLRCGNHVAKNHAIKLDKLRKLKEMTTNDGVRVECYCKGKKHAKHCGCLTEKFIRKAKASFQMCLTNAGTDPNAFSEKLMNLALHHFQDEHQWDGGQCDFHPLVVCSCGSCTDKYNLKCQGKPYKSDQVLKCPFHTLAYKLECQEKAGLADVLIHPEIGKVTTNPVEASHNVLVRYRSKNWNLARLHYHVSTNIGLIQGCMTYRFTKRGPQYHWILDILERMCLPVVQNLPSILEKLNADRFFDIKSKTTNVAKARRKLYKRKRKVFEHQRRQLFVKESAMNHNYGRDASTEEVIADALTDKCKCGSTDHRRTSHKSCPLRRTCDTATGIDTSCDINASKSDDNVSEYDHDCYDFECSLSDKTVVESCACPNFPCHKWDCPDNVRYRKRAMDSSLTPGALWTPPLKKMGLNSLKVPSPLVLSKVKDQSTPALGSVIVPCNASTAEKVGSATVSTPSFVLGKTLEMSVSKCCSTSNTLVLPQIPRQSTPVVHISHTVSTVHKVGSHSTCTPTSVDNMPEVHVSLSKCPSPSMTPGPSKLNKQNSHLAVAKTVGSPSVHTPILLQNKKWDFSVPLNSVTSKSTPTSIHKMREVQVSLRMCPSPSMTPSPSKLKEQSFHLAVAEEVGSPSVCTPSLFQNKKLELSVPRCLLTPFPFKMKDHRTTGVDSVTVPHNDFVGQKVAIKSFHSLESGCLIDEEKTNGASKVLHEMLSNRFLAEK
uniref:Uncharacterized protein n=1 Tax=Amphimedon queenslandica TaxID=400682 RepID=A0A1X7UCX7_AMPQE